MGREIPFAGHLWHRYTRRGIQMKLFFHTNWFLLFSWELSEFSVWCRRSYPAASCPCKSTSVCSPAPTPPSPSKKRPDSSTTLSPTTFFTLHHQIFLKSFLMHSTKLQWLHRGHPICHVKGVPVALDGLPPSTGAISTWINTSFLAEERPIQSSGTSPRRVFSRVGSGTL